MPKCTGADQHVQAMLWAPITPGERLDKTRDSEVVVPGFRSYALHGDILRICGDVDRLMLKV
ncbi:uncharacterized protein N7511_001895 [Penicillium nucicola]|uniref:uncharacterized protein n=1 Tax=Penicillium nucicola TaxID=1850975 RepID=UPI00254502D9|nr:uncharacterized protein N7511_001895 [Penicillium nucicola]KAJ5769844.1 hypothetical protein N7511_001895 [Penicillium nucicola]